MRNKALLAAGLFVLQNHGAFAHVTLAVSPAPIPEAIIWRSSMSAMALRRFADHRTARQEATGGNPYLATPGQTRLDMKRGARQMPLSWQGRSAGAHVAETFAVRMRICRMFRPACFPCDANLRKRR